MKKVIAGFDNLLSSLETEDGYNEGTILLLRKMIKEEPSLVGKVISKFHTSNDEDIKGILAALIVRVEKNQEYFDYLKKFHHWTDDDFKEV